MTTADCIIYQQLTDYRTLLSPLNYNTIMEILYRQYNIQRIKKKCTITHPPCLYETILMVKCVKWGKKRDKNLIFNVWVVFVLLAVQQLEDAAVKWEPLSTGWVRSGVQWRLPATFRVANYSFVVHYYTVVVLIEKYIW